MKTTKLLLVMFFSIVVAACSGGGGSGGSPSPASATNHWSKTGSLPVGLALHTATLLPNNKVLVAGGGSYSIGCVGCPFRNATLYDPATGSWTATGSLTTARDLHTATLLANGKVLITGGLGSPGSPGPLASAELYDPATGSWTATGSLTTARGRHTATLLASGKVLITGGQTLDIGSLTSYRSYETGALASAELYDPAAGSWSATGSLSYKRENHAATLLVDGKVLATGGIPYYCETNSCAELYDPATGSWIEMRGNPTTPQGLVPIRSNHTATLLADGKVLVAGGTYIFSDAAGGFSTLDKAELYQ